MTGLALQRCADCGRLQYPARDLCRNCLSDRLNFEEADSSGRVLAVAELHATLELERWGKQLPLTAVTVALDAGATVIALTDGKPRIGDPVTVVRKQDMLKAAPQ